MSSVDDIRNAIAAVISTVEDVGQVHLYERYIKNQGDLVAIYGYQGHLRGWHIRRIAIQEGAIGDGVPDEVQIWRIVGYMALNDAGESELVFDRLIDGIRDAFRADPTLGGVVATTWVDKAAGIQMPDSGPVNFAGVICHKAILMLATQQFCFD